MNIFNECYYYSTVGQNYAGIYCIGLSAAQCGRSKIQW